MSNETMTGPDMLFHIVAVLNGVETFHTSYMEKAQADAVVLVINEKAIVLKLGTRYVVKAGAFEKKSVVVPLKIFTKADGSLTLDPKEAGTPKITTLDKIMDTEDKKEVPKVVGAPGQVGSTIPFVAVEVNK